MSSNCQSQRLGILLVSLGELYRQRDGGRGFRLRHSGSELWKWGLTSHHSAWRAIFGINFRAHSVTFAVVWLHRIAYKHRPRLPCRRRIVRDCSCCWRLLDNRWRKLCISVEIMDCPGESPLLDRLHESGSPHRSPWASDPIEMNLKVELFLLVSSGWLSACNVYRYANTCRTLPRHLGREPQLIFFLERQYLIPQKDEVAAL